MHEPLLPGSQQGPQRVRVDLTCLYRLKVSMRAKWNFVWDMAWRCAEFLKLYEATTCTRQLPEWVEAFRGEAGWSSPSRGPTWEGLVTVTQSCHCHL